MICERLTTPIAILIILSVLTIGTLIGGPMVRAEDDTQSERSDLDLSRHDRGELWDDDSHEVSIDYHREREYNRGSATEREGHSQDREMHRDREREQDHDSIREQLREHDREHDSASDREKHND